MIEGRIDEGYPIINIILRLANRPALQIEFVVDTGFAGFLTMPPAAIAALQVPFFYKMPANLADDTNIMVNVHIATIEWQGHEREIEIMAIGRRPLIGRSLVRGNELCIEFIKDGRVQINRLGDAIL